jgi:hypothetical protein
MKIAVSAIGPSTDDLVKARFGRATFFQRTDRDIKIQETKSLLPGFSMRTMHASRTVSKRLENNINNERRKRYAF